MRLAPASGGSLSQLYICGVFVGLGGFRASGFWGSAFLFFRLPPPRQFPVWRPSKKHRKKRLNKFLQSLNSLNLGRMEGPGGGPNLGPPKIKRWKIILKSPPIFEEKNLFKGFLKGFFEKP